MISLVVEGWRCIPHSYSIVDEFICLELLKRSEIQLFHHDVAYLDPHWQPNYELHDPGAAKSLQTIPVPPPDLHPDQILRVSIPFNLKSASTESVCLFVTSECGIVPEDRVIEGSLATLDSHFIFFTSSHWSAKGLIHSGVDPDQIHVIPLGVDPAIFQPVSASDRQQLRQTLGWDGFIFLNVSGMLPGKGIDRLLKAFAVVIESFPDARLALKGSELVYPGGEDRVSELLLDLSPQQVEQVAERLIYTGDVLSFQQLAQLYQAADVYVSPYLAEGFNLPVLEAIACGLPVICTQGGSTEDFTPEAITLKISSTTRVAWVGQAKRSKGYILEPDVDHLIQLMIQSIEQESLRSQAAHVGPEWVEGGYTWRHCVDQLLQIL